MGKPSVHPMGTIIYKPEKCFNGYTLFQAAGQGATLIDMNGGVVNHWHNLQGFPNKMLPGGQVFGSRGERNSTYGWQDQKDLVQVDWDGKVVWEFKQNEYIEDPGYEGEWMARQHHDFQREGNTVGYYVPGMEGKTNSGNTLILTHCDVVNPEMSLHTLIDDRIIEVDWDGNIVWDWKCNEHFDEMGFDEAAKNVIARNPTLGATGKGDWMHINSMSVLGPNKWYEAGDERFNPENIIIDGRQTNIIAIIEKKTGKPKTFYINDKLKRVLKEYTKGRNLDEPLFLGKQGKRLDRSQVYRFIVKVCKEHDIKVHVSTHTLRRSFG